MRNTATYIPPSFVTGGLGSANQTTTKRPSLGQCDIAHFDRPSASVASLEKDGDKNWSPFAFQMDRIERTDLKPFFSRFSRDSFDFPRPTAQCILTHVQDTHLAGEKGGSMRFLDELDYAICTVRARAHGNDQGLFMFVSHVETSSHQALKL